jgi:hypothetical protein
MRAMWYQTMLRLRESDDVQKKGVVVLRYDVGLPSPMEVSVIRQGGNLGFPGKSCSLLAALPLKIKGFHFCYDDDQLVPSLNISQMLMGRDLRVRFRAHSGKQFNPEVTGPSRLAIHQRPT